MALCNFCQKIHVFAISEFFWAQFNKMFILKAAQNFKTIIQSYLRGYYDITLELDEEFCESP